MSARSIRLLIGVCVVSMFCSVSAAPVIAGEAYTGEVITERVNVRSGPSTNYYVVTRMKAGERVNVVDQESGWLAIVPPAGCYSLISKDYVDVGAGGEGVVNGSNVRVRAGSDTDSHRYAVQRKMQKGEAVRILGDAGDGFLKIAPPSEAYVWVHGDYVARVPEGRLQQQPRAVAALPPVAPTKTKPAAPIKTTESSAPTASTKALVKQSDKLVEIGPQSSKPANAAVEQKIDDTTMAAIEARIDEPAAESSVAADTPTEVGIIHRPPPASAMVEMVEMTDTADTGATPSTTVTNASASGSAVPIMSADAYRDRLESIDVAMKAEMAKPVADRHLDQVLADYRALASGELDHVTSAFVQRRIQQIEAAATTADALREIRSLSDQVTQDRRDALAARSNLRQPTRGITRGLDAKGELRESMIYASPVGPRRYRLIDPDLDIPRTLCYVEVPRELPINIESYLGRIVGVRASGKYLETGDVNPIPIVVAEELIILDDPRSPAGGAQGVGSVGSVESVEVREGVNVTTIPASTASSDDAPERVSVASVSP